MIHLAVALTSVLTHAVLGSEMNASSAPNPPEHFAIRTNPAAHPVDLEPGPHLFVDEYLIAESDGLVQKTHPPQRAQDRPILGWEQSTTQPYVTVVRDPDTKLFRMWYNHSIGSDCAIAYAESEDGIRWRTPSLGLLGDTNRLFVISAPFQNGYGVSVIDEGPDFEDASRRYKVAWWAQTTPWPDGDPGMRVAFSPDGIHWTPFEDNPVLPDFSEVHFLDDPRRPYGVGDIVDVYWDPIRERYAAFFKTPAIPADGLETAPRARTYIRRLVSASTSRDFVQWERPRRVVMPEERDAGLLEFYSVGGTIARGPLLIGFVRMLHDDYPVEPGGPPDGIGYSTLVTSRDGVHWERHDDVFFGRSPNPGQWDRAMAWIGSALPVGDELYLYYGGYKRGHKVEPTRERQLGLAKMPMDRFVSRGTSADAPGRLLTVPFKHDGLRGRRIVLNAAAAAGSIRVRVCREDGEPVPGVSESPPVTGNGQRLPVAGLDLAAVGEDPVRFAFNLDNARLFGFDVVPESP